ncbi:hypothetical protein [Hyphomicrobium facile]|uniref:hypothetical protein n=1 Tax=Hyphomicrobium facile TaxID=51670 RepID=UPI001FCDD3AB|nr:hypothetical protein [Hyphomicrobium facile]
MHIDKARDHSPPVEIDDTSARIQSFCRAYRCDAAILDRHRAEGLVLSVEKLAVYQANVGRSTFAFFAPTIFAQTFEIEMFKGSVGIVGKSYRHR